MIARLLTILAPDSVSRERDWDSENEQTRAFCELIAVERRIDELEVRRASLKREFRERTRQVQDEGGRR